MADDGSNTDELLWAVLVPDVVFTKTYLDILTPERPWGGGTEMIGSPLSVEDGV